MKTSVKIPDSIKEAVVILNEKGPKEWWNKIKVSKLRMSDPDLCVIGQIYDEYSYTHILRQWGLINHAIEPQFANYTNDWKQLIAALQQENQTVRMSFCEAVRKMYNGSKVSLPHWNNKDAYLVYNKTTHQIVWGDGSVFPMGVMHDWIESNEWEIYVEPLKVCLKDVKPSQKFYFKSEGEVGLVGYYVKLASLPNELRHCFMYDYCIGAREDGNQEVVIVGD
jgi:hypothetical protein